MKNSFAKAFAIGLATVVVVVGAVLFMQRGAHLDLPGYMRVRTIATSENESLALVDLHLTNPSDYAFEVRNVTVTLETTHGDATQTIVSRIDALRLFDSMPHAGPFHPTLYTNFPIPPHTTADYTIAASFSMPEYMLKDRQRFVVKIEEVNGKVVELRERE